MNKFIIYVGMIVYTTSGHQQGVLMKVWAIDNDKDTATIKAIDGMMTVHMTFDDYPITKLRPFHIQAGDYIRQKTLKNEPKGNIFEVMDMYPETNGHNAKIRVFDHTIKEIKEIYLQHHKSFGLCDLNGNLL